MYKQLGVGNSTAARFRPSAYSGDFPAGLLGFFFGAPLPGTHLSAPRVFDPILGLRPALDLSALRAFLSSWVRKDVSRRVPNLFVLTVARFLENSRRLKHFLQILLHTNIF